MGHCMAFGVLHFTGLQCYNGVMWGIGLFGLGLELGEI
jgi:hypothetical protein